MRTILHVDMDAFFVSVEEVFDPSLRGKPVIVGGRPDQRGVVSAASYAARAFGVHSAMPLRNAARLCPQGIFLEGHPERYREYSSRVKEVLQSFSPVMEMASIDEAYLDLTGCERLHGPPMAAAHRLHDRIRQATGLNCSIGAAASRLVAKICSDLAKPNGLLWVQPGLEARFLAPLDIRKIPGIGKVTERQLHELGIKKVGDLARLDEAFLEARFGGWGLALAGKAKGMDAGGWYDAPIGAGEAQKSISHEHTFGEDAGDVRLIEATLVHLAEMVGRRLREHGLFARTVGIKIRYGDFSTFTRAHTLDHPSQLDSDLLGTARVLLEKNWTRKPLRLLGLSASNLESAEGQLSLLDQDRNERWRKALRVVDQLRDRYGDSTVSLAGGLRGRFRERVHEAAPMPPDKTRREDQ